MSEANRETYGYYWFRHKADGTTFIACRDADDGKWYVPAIGHPISRMTLRREATLLGPVPRRTADGASIDQ